MEHNLLSPNFQLFAGFPSSDLADVIRESLAFLDRHPALLAMVDADLDAYGLQKKAQRLQRQRELLASHPSLGIGETPTTDTVDMTLAAGRRPPPDTGPGGFPVPDFAWPLRVGQRPGRL